MPKAKNTEGNEQEVTQEEAAEVQSAEGLSSRDALEVALEATRTPAAEESGGTEGTSGTEAKGEAGNATPEIQAEPPLSPPAEWNKEEKEDFGQMSRKAQEAALRIHKARNAHLEEIKREAAELQWVKDYHKELTPFFKARGEKDPSPAEIVKALRAVNEIDADPKKAMIQIFQAKGLPIPKELLEEKTEELKTPVIDSASQERLNRVESFIEAQQREQAAKVLQAAWSSFEQAKNGAGTLKYPDLDDSEAGLRLASNIGSLVRGDNELSKQFIEHAKSRIPDLTFEKLVDMAYRYYGGRVDDSPAAKTQDPQKHLIKSNRAASSVPGRGGGANAGTVRKFASRREALAAALAEVNGD